MKTKKVRNCHIKLPGGVKAQVPTCTNYVSQDEDGQWWAYAKKPIKMEDHWDFFVNTKVKPLRITREHKHGWENSLRKLVRGD